jgi:hypothetical protein
MTLAETLTKNGQQMLDMADKLLLFVGGRVR